MFIQWAPLNWIMVNEIIRLLGSNRTRFSSTKKLFGTLFMYLLHSVIGIDRVVESFWACPKVIPLNDVYCNTKFIIYHLFYFKVRLIWLAWQPPWLTLAISWLQHLPWTTLTPRPHAKVRVEFWQTSEAKLKTTSSSHSRSVSQFFIQANYKMKTKLSSPITVVWLDIYINV